MASNSYQALPASSNASFNIAEDISDGTSNAAQGGSKATGQNVGTNSGMASNDGMGITGEWVVGTVGSREGMEGGGGPKANRGQFGLSARGGDRTEGQTASFLGSGARARGVAAAPQGSTPGRSGSMALAAAGLKGSGSLPAIKPSRPNGNRSMIKSDAGMRENSNANNQ